MKKNNKELLLSELCAMLPYGVKTSRNNIFDKRRKEVEVLSEITTSYEVLVTLVDELKLKPYLRPMSSMTSNEWREYCYACFEDNKSWFMAGNGKYKITLIANKEKFLRSHLFDYNNLIEKGLALEAPEDMYKKE